MLFTNKKKSAKITKCKKPRCNPRQTKTTTNLKMPRRNKDSERSKSVPTQLNAKLSDENFGNKVFPKEKTHKNKKKIRKEAKKKI